jgi:hypothetical protein
MYFDDITNNWQFQGEMLAIKEFNTKSEEIKISPEFIQCPLRWTERVNTNSIFLYYKPDTPSHEWGMSRLKICMRFSHPRFNRTEIKGKAVFNS